MAVTTANGNKLEETHSGHSQDHTDRKNNLLPHDKPNGSDQKPLSQHDTRVHQNLSRCSTSTDSETSNQLPPPQQFEEDFQALQQQIQEQHLILEAKIQSFLAFLEQTHDNTLQTVFPPPARNSMIDASYSRPAVVKYFCEVYCSPMLPDTQWHHCRTRQSNSQHIPPTTCIFYSTNGRPDDNNPTVPPPNMTRSVPRSIITATTKPPFYDDTFSKGK